MPDSTPFVRTPDLPVDAPAGGGDHAPGNLGPSTGGASPWPERCTLAELARILTMMYGPRAPSESSLKNWSRMGVFDGCQAPEPLTEQQALPSFTREALMRPRRAGRPGLCLNTDLALTQIYEQWPHLADSTPNAVFELAVAQASDRLHEAMLSLAPGIVSAAPISASVPAQALASANLLALPAAPVATNPAGAPAAGAEETQLDRIERVLSSVAADLVIVKREVAQFSTLRNNLLTKLDDAVTRAQQVLSLGTRGAGGPDPLAEAKRDRDMGVLKGMLGDILAKLDGE